MAERGFIMKLFKVPFDLKREEKIFGGYLSLRQVIYVMLSASSLCILLLPLNLIIKLMLIIPIVIFFLLCAFFKSQELNFDKFFFYALKFVLRKKNYIYERCDK